MDRNTKIAQVKDIISHYNSFSYAIIINYSNLKAGEIAELKKTLNSVNSSKFKVFKNSLHDIALSEMSMASLSDSLKGQMGVIFTNDIVPVSNKISQSPSLKKNKSFAFMTDKIKKYGLQTLSQLTGALSDDDIRASLLRTMSEPSARIARLCSAKIK